MPTFVRSTEGTSTGATLTLNIQVTGSDAVLIVGLAYKDNSVLTPDSILFNGAEAFVVARAAADGGDAQCLLWVLTGPTVTTANVVITMPSSVRMVGYTALFTNVNQSTPFVVGNMNDANGTDTNPTITITSAADEIVVDAMAQVSAGPDTIDANSSPNTLLMDGAATGGGTDTRGGGQWETGTGSRLMDYTLSSDDNWNIVAGGLQEPGAGNIKTVDTIAIASVKTIDTIAIANVKTRDTISNV